MADISKRFYANRATQRHQQLAVEFRGFHSDNLRETVEFSINANDSYLRVSLTPTEAMHIAQRLMRFATIIETNNSAEGK